MEERETEILEAAIRDYIREGEPVSSGSLYKRHKFGIRPAMIRSVLARLTDLGFLEQPHHSAGRVPTDIGYEFFAGRALASSEPGREETARFREMLSGGHWDELASDLSRYLGLAAVAENYRAGIVRKYGLENLFGNLEWDSRAALMEVARDFEGVDARLTEIERGLEKVGVFVGKKSPVTQSRDLSVVTGMYNTPDGPVILLAIGPRRMNYEKALRVFKGLKSKTKK